MEDEEQSDGAKCQNCGSKEVKYRCPECNRRTCSLRCVKRHKVVFSCTGVRCKTAYLPIKEYNDNSMLSDYRFLEDTSRVAYSVLHDDQNKRKHWNKQVVNFLKKARQSGVTLRLMAVGMKKRKENSSYFDNRQKCIMWRIHWLFPQAEADYIDRRISENDVLENTLKRFIDSKEGDPVKRQRLKPYCQAGIENICVFMKKENQPANRARYYKLDKSKTIRECLEHKTIIEYPSFHVVLIDKVHGYPVVGTTGEVGHPVSGTSKRDNQPDETNVSNVVGNSERENQMKKMHGHPVVQNGGDGQGKEAHGYPVMETGEEDGQMVDAHAGHPVVETNGGEYSYGYPVVGPNEGENQMSKAYENPVFETSDGVCEVDSSNGNPVVAKHSHRYPVAETQGSGEIHIDKTCGHPVVGLTEEKDGMNCKSR